MTRQLFSKLKQKNDNMNLYFRNSREDIKKANLRILCVLSMAAIITIILFSFITMLIIPWWRPSVYHYIFAILMVIFFIASIYFNIHEPEKNRLVTILSSIFVICLMLSLCILDTMLSPDKSEIFVGLFIVVAPILFIVPFNQMILFQSGYLIFFAIMSHIFKYHEITRTDLLASILSFGISIVIYGIVMNVRIEEFLQKNLYKISSERDMLTGISNRASCESRINRILANRDVDSCYAMMVLDVDNFKNINDTLGHDKGDEVLASVAHNLTDIFRKTDVVGRYGGDEFVIFMEDFDNIELIEKKCESIRERMKSLLDGRFNISCSVGVCISNDSDLTLEKMFKVADDALYETKALNKGGYLIRKFNSRASNEELPLMVIIDDNLIDRETIAVQFEDNYRIEKFEDGKSALEYIKKNSTDIAVIIVDMVMPARDGNYILKDIRGNIDTSNIPVVAVSSDEFTEEDALVYGADDMVFKPIVPAIIKLRVEKVIKQGRM